MITTVHDARHATLMQAYIKDMQAKGYTLVGVEVPYNYYGQRGFIDVVLRRTTPQGEEWLVSEIKSTLLDIGEAIRQVNRAREYFLMGSTCLAPTNARVTYNLVLRAVDSNVRLWRMHQTLLDGVPVVWQPVEDESSGEATHKFEVALAIASMNSRGLTRGQFATGAQ